MLAPGFDDGAVGQHHFEVEDPVLGDAVFHGTWPAAVLGEVAAKGAGATRGRVHGVHQSVLGGGVGQFFGDDPGLDHGLVVERVDGQDTVHPAQGKRNASADRQGAATQTRARTAGRDGHAMAVRPSQDGRDLCRGFGLENHIGHEDQIFRLVRAVLRPLVVAPMDAPFPHQFRANPEGGLVDVLGQGRGWGRSRFHGRCVILGACQK